MSGGLPKIFGRRAREPKVPTRPKLPEPKKLPKRFVFKVEALPPKKLDPLARVKKARGKQHLLFLTSKYIVDLENKSEKKQNQALQVCLHELMHMALWDDISIEHSDDPNSLLYYHISGETLGPTTWDLQQMKMAAKRIGVIEIYDSALVGNTKFHGTLLKAMEMWNEWVEKPLFVRKAGLI